MMSHPKRPGSRKTTCRIGVSRPSTVKTEDTVEGAKVSITQLAQPRPALLGPPSPPYPPHPSAHPHQTIPAAAASLVQTQHHQQLHHHASCRTTTRCLHRMQPSIRVRLPPGATDKGPIAGLAGHWPRPLLLLLSCSSGIIIIKHTLKTNCPAHPWVPNSGCSSNLLESLAPLAHSMVYFVHPFELAQQRPEFGTKLGR